MELQEKQELTQKQIASWLKVSYSTFRNNKDKYLKILSDYIEYEEKGKNIVVTKVFKSTYQRETLPLEDWIMETIPRLNKENGFYFGTGKSIGHFLQPRINEWREKHGFKPWTTKYCNQKINDTCRVLFGEKEYLKIYKHLTEPEKRVCGTKLGVQLKELIIKLDDTTFRPLTKEEKLIFYNITANIYDTHTEEIIEREKFIDELLSDKKFNTMTGAEIKKELEGFFHPFPAAVQQFKIETGLDLIIQGSAYLLR